MSVDDGRQHRPDLLFIVGCPRSGTTWLQLLLSQHPAVATLKESHLFDDFIGPMLRNWDSLAEDPRRTGIESVLSRGEFVEFLTSFAHEVIDRIAGEATELVLDKTPDHALWTTALLTVFPEASILHLVRDPRDVVASLLAASSGWGSHWAPRTVFGAAWRWTDYVEGARKASRQTRKYRELRYEDLYAKPEEELEALLRWLSLEAPSGFASRAVEEASIGRMRAGATSAPWDLRDEPDGFVRRGGTANWRSDLSASQVKVIEYISAELMDAYGYAPEHSRRLPPLRLYPHWLRDQLLKRLKPEPQGR